MGRHAGFQVLRIDRIEIVQPAGVRRGNFDVERVGCSHGERAAMPLCTLAFGGVFTNLRRSDLGVVDEERDTGGGGSVLGRNIIINCDLFALAAGQLEFESVTRTLQFIGVIEISTSAIPDKSVVIDYGISRHLVHVCDRRRGEVLCGFQRQRILAFGQKIVTVVGESVYVERAFTPTRETLGKEEHGTFAATERHFTKVIDECFAAREREDVGEETSPVAVEFHFGRVAEAPRRELGIGDLIDSFFFDPNLHPFSLCQHGVLGIARRSHRCLHPS